MPTSFDDPGAVEDPRGFDFGGLLNNVLKTAGDLGKAYVTPQQAPPPQRVTQPTPAAQPSWLMPVLIGGGVLVLLMFAGVIFTGRK